MATTSVAASIFGCFGRKTAVTDQVQVQDDSYRPRPTPTTTTNAGAVSSDITPEMIHALITILGPDQCPRSANELLRLYIYREEELLYNLKKLVVTKYHSEIDAHVIKLGLPKSSSELLSIYQGREDELFRMLQLMECKQHNTNNNRITIEIINLISELDLSKSVNELLTTYEGHELVLLDNLLKLKNNPSLLRQQQIVATHRQEDDYSSLSSSDISELHHYMQMLP
jgi:hypothetical protein